MTNIAAAGHGCIHEHHVLHWTSMPECEETWREKFCLKSWLLPAVWFDLFSSHLKHKWRSPGPAHRSDLPLSCGWGHVLWMWGNDADGDISQADILQLLFWSNDLYNNRPLSENYEPVHSLRRPTFVIQKRNSPEGRVIHGASCQSRLRPHHPKSKLQLLQVAAGLWPRQIILQFWELRYVLCEVGISIENFELLVLIVLTLKSDSCS